MLLAKHVNTRFLKACHCIHRRGLHLLNQKAIMNGEWVDAKSGKIFNVFNPATGEVIGSVPNMNVEDTRAAIKTAADTFQTWKLTSHKERSQLLRKWFELLEQNGESIAKLMTAEAGKPIAESRGEVAYGNSFIEWFAGQTRLIRGETIPSPVSSRRLFIERYPIGVTAIVTPWNFPLAMITRKVGAALASGCTCVIKPAEDTPFTALAAVQLAMEAGIPKGVLNVVTCDRSNTAEVGKLLCESPDVAGVFFTGSTAVGKILYKQCSLGIKRCGLELGGNAPFIVYKSANIDDAVSAAMTSKFRNCGQACVAANRFLIQKEVYPLFVDKVTNAVSSLTLGDVTSPEVKIGPLINEAQFQKVASIVEDAVSKGAKVLAGGKPATQYGKLYYEPTVLVNVKENMIIYNEEIFGPVMALIEFETEDDSLKIANSVNTGLAGYFFSQDVSQIFRVSKLLEVGMVGINEGLISTCEAPFGGIKESGIGREGSHHGIEDYTYYKYICLGNLN